MNDRISCRLGLLAGPLATYCQKHGTTPSDVIRAALAKRLGVDAPEMPQGNPGIAEQASVGADARWKAKRRRLT